MAVPNTDEMTLRELKAYTMNAADDTDLFVHKRDAHETLFDKTGVLKLCEECSKANDSRFYIKFHEPLPVYSLKQPVIHGVDVTDVPWMPDLFADMWRRKLHKLGVDGGGDSSASSASKHGVSPFSWSDIPPPDIGYSIFVLNGDYQLPTIDGVNRRFDDIAQYFTISGEWKSKIVRDLYGTHRDRLINYIKKRN